MEIDKTYLDRLFKADPYSMNHKEKNQVLTQILKELTSYHIENCKEYREILSAYGYDESLVNNLNDIPFLPVRMFKEYYLHSVPECDIKTRMTSSGTSGQKVSQIALDIETSTNQKKVLSHIISSYIGPDRLPLLVLDSKNTLRDRKLFGARGAGILGFSILGKDITYALDDEMNLNIEAIENFLVKHEGQIKLLFGYTFMVWSNFYLALKEKNIKFDFEGNAQLFHIGGWKKLKELAVSNKNFSDSLKNQCNIGQIHNYYGMAEQLGSVYVECEYGHLHASNFSDVIIRNPKDWSVQPIGKKGLIQLVSVLPKSYPGHSILTEDEGMIEGEDDCPCGRKGKYFKIFGRIKNAEIRGCSDTYADKISRQHS